MIARISRRLRRALNPPALPTAAAAERLKDRAGLPELDPGTDRAIDEGIAWIGRAQDRSGTRDGGVARHYSLIDGWGGSYPETTGYIVPTLLEYASARGGEPGVEARRRARLMLDWLVSIQLPGGGFPGGTIDQASAAPVTFNTGQVLLGLAAGAGEFGGPYLGPLTRAADWLAGTQDPDGCWRRFPSPFAGPGEKTYETHVAWGLLEAYRVRPDGRYLRAALANVRWALGRQRGNGWFEGCCLEDPSSPLTHTLGYALRGVLEAHRSTGDPSLLASARRTADGLLSAMGPGGFLPGRLDSRWRARARWACLTGTAQVAHCLLRIGLETGGARYLDAGRAANRYVRRTLDLDGPPETRGGVKGAFPVDGRYGPYQYPNWACKFAVDSNLLERAIGP